MGRFTIVACSNAIEGRSDEYVDWYVNQHMGDVLDIDGFVAGQFCRIVPPAGGEQPHWGFAAIYSLEGESLQPILDGLVARRGTDRMPMTDAIDLSRTFLAPAETVAVPMASAAGEQSGDQRSEHGTNMLLVFSDPVAGREQEYEDWYGLQHIPDVLAIPGFLGAQRWRFQEWGPRPAPTRNLVLYQLDNPGAALAEMRQRAGTDRMPISPALNRDSVHMLLAEPIARKGCLPKEYNEGVSKQ